MLISAPASIASCRQPAWPLSAATWATVLPFCSHPQHQISSMTSNTNKYTRIERVIQWVAMRAPCTGCCFAFSAQNTCHCCRCQCPSCPCYCCPCYCCPCPCCPCPCCLCPCCLSYGGISGSAVLLLRSCILCACVPHTFVSAFTSAPAPSASRRQPA